MSTDLSTDNDQNWVLPDAVFDGQDLHINTAFRVENNQITLRKDGAGKPMAGTITPGFFDIQVNGGGGVFFNDAPTMAGAAAIADAHRAFGTTAILPTLITDEPGKLDAATDAFLGGPMPTGVLGIHIEGPHIDVARKGTHNPALIRPFDARTMNAVQRLRDGGIPVLITVAPEAMQPGQIAALCDVGVVVSIGHSDCPADVAQAAFAEGAQLVTHLFNAMSQMQGRAPGLAGAAINSDAYCSIICDNIHVSPDMIGLTYRARPQPDRMILVSDAMPTVGGPDSFMLYGSVVCVKNGRLINAEGSLAGAHVTLLESVKNLVETVGLDLQVALRSAITHPARLMGVSDQFALGPADHAYVLGANWQMTPLTAQAGQSPD